MLFTYLVIAVTALISIYAFNNQSLIQKLILYPSVMNRPAEYYRLVTSGFIHADWNHLIVNMFTMYFFGRTAEAILGELFGTTGSLLFILFYLSAIAIASAPSVGEAQK